MRHVIRATTDPDRKKREKDEVRERKAREKEERKRKNEDFDRKVKAAVTPGYMKHVPGYQAPEQPSDVVAGVAPPPKGFDVCSGGQMFRARIKTHLKSFFALHKTLAMTYFSEGTVFEFEPAGSGYHIFAYGMVQYSSEPISRVYLVAENGRLKFNVDPNVKPHVFVLRAEKKQFSILHDESQKLLCAEEHCVKVDRDPKKVGGWEKFTLSFPKEKESFRALSLDPVATALHAFVAQINARRHKKKGGVGVVSSGDVGFSKVDCEWEFLPQKNGHYHVRNVGTQRFLGVEHEGVVLSETPHAWKVDGDWNSTYSFRCVATDKLMYAEKAELKCNKTKKGEWETFEISRA